MIVSCPSCATKYDLPSESGSDATVMRCGSCGHGWIEAHATDVSDLVPVRAQSSKPDTDDDDAEARVMAEARKIARAARHAEHRARTARHRRSAQIRGWTGLAAGICLVLGAVVAMPERIVQAAPAAAKLYSLAGKTVNVYGLNISSIQQQYMIVNGQPVLALAREYCKYHRTGPSRTAAAVCAQKRERRTASYLDTEQCWQRSDWRGRRVVVRDPACGTACRCGECRDSLCQARRNRLNCCLGSGSQIIMVFT